jgi:mannose-1-phosphate guanylyltransferase
MSTSDSWAIVLAAGEGSRLRELTTRDGVSTPKQFCSLRGGRSLLGEALARAARIVPRKRIVVVVADEHRSLWERELQALPPENVIVQPRNRGTAAGIMLPALHVLARDPEARMAFLPSDHHVEQEEVIGSSLRMALASLEETEGGLTLLGITPDGPETGYGWIVPAPSDRVLRPVERFVEKPDADKARGLFARGALWNSFLFAVKGSALLDLLARRLPTLTHAMQAVFESTDGRASRLANLSGRLAAHDFSRDVLQSCAGEQRLVVVPPCGWTDLGTPSRVRQCLEGLRVARVPAAAPMGTRAALDLALALQSSAGKGTALSA